MSPVDIGIVGGGINGLCCAWQLAKQGNKVHVYKRDTLMKATSTASSKILHGELRYLENREFRLVNDALREQDAWTRRVRHLAKPLRLVMPIYQQSRRPSWVIALGLFLDDHLAGKRILLKAKLLSAQELISRDAHPKSEGLEGGYESSDGQMDDQALALCLWPSRRGKRVSTSAKTLKRNDSRRPDHYCNERNSPPRSTDRCGWSLDTTTVAAKRT